MGAEEKNRKGEKRPGWIDLERGGDKHRGMETPCKVESRAGRTFLAAEGRTGGLSLV